MTIGWDQWGTMLRMDVLRMIYSINDWSNLGFMALSINGYNWMVLLTAYATVIGACGIWIGALYLGLGIVRMAISVGLLIRLEAGEALDSM